MADGAPALERVLSSEDPLLELLLDTDARLTELERKSYVLAVVGPGEVTVFDVDQLLVNPHPDVRAYVIEDDTWYVPGVVGAGVGPEDRWVPEP